MNWFMYAKRLIARLLVLVVAMMVFPGTLFASAEEMTATKEFSPQTLTMANPTGGTIDKNWYSLSDDGITARVTNESFTAAKASAGGVISPAGIIGVNEGQSQTFTLLPEAGYEIDSLKIDGFEYGAEPTYTFDNIRKNHTIEAGFMPIDGIVREFNTQTIQPTSALGGQISLDWFSVSDAQGLRVQVQDPNFQASLSGGYVRSKLLPSMNWTGYDAYQIYIDTTADTQNAVSLCLGFMAKKSDGSGAWCDLYAGSEVALIPDLGEQVVCPVSNDRSITLPVGFKGYVRVPLDSLGAGFWNSNNAQNNFNDVAQWSIDYLTIAVSGTMQPVYFKRLRLVPNRTFHTITASAGANGIISPVGNTQVRHGRSKTFTIRPNEGYGLAKLLVNGVPVNKTLEYTCQNIKADTTIEAIFTPLGSEQDHKVLSPNGKLAFRLLYDGMDLFYSVTQNEKVVIDKSALGLTVDADDIGAGVAIDSVAYPTSQADTYSIPVQGNMVTDNHNSMLANLKSQDGGLDVAIEIRVWDDGFAFQYLFDNETGRAITAESTQFSLPNDARAIVQYCEPA
ncbi:MAG: glycoside hydrolase family 97 N-terminal domain-containing protein, partial [Oscillospiraceae bacterium]|nr:glycoside hydrolase family 97 N-terminal domain-containing protein [Oscillospiraceae bacterium]